MQSNFTFDVLVLTPKSGWTSVSRWQSADQARQEAQKLVSSDKHEGVKITQEHFDYAENQFLEKTIFLRTRSGSKMPTKDTPPDDVYFGNRGDLEMPERGTNPIIWIAGIATALGILIGVGMMLLFHGGSRLGPAPRPDLVQYELPTVRTSVTKNGEIYALQMTLQMELYNADDSQAVEANLASIMEVIIDQLRHTDAKDLNSRSGLQRLRAKLHLRVADVMGTTRFYDILFKDIQVRLH